MKKLLSILAAVGLTATTAASVVACGSSDKTEQKPLITGAYYNNDKGTAKVAIVFDKKIDFAPKASMVHITNGAIVKGATIDSDDNQVIDVILDKALAPKHDTTYTVTVDDTRFTYGNAFVIIGSDPTAPVEKGDEVKWSNTSDTANEINNVSFTLDSWGDNVDLTVPPTIAYDAKSTGAFSSVVWDMGLKNFRITLKDGLEKTDYKFYVSFKLKKGTDNSQVQELTATKSSATQAESTVSWRRDYAENDPTNNKASWYWSSVGAEVDLTQKPDIKVAGIEGTPIADVSLDANLKKITVTLNDGLPKGNMLLEVSFKLKNGFKNDFPVNLVLNKDKVTPKESTLNWVNKSVNPDDNNQVSWKVKDDGYGKELDLQSNPMVKVSNNPSGMPVIQKIEWLPESKTLTVTLRDGLSKGHYDFEVSFRYINKFSGFYKTTLTVKKDNPTPSEIKITSSKPDGTVGKPGLISTPVVWTIDNFGADVNRINLVKLVLDGKTLDIMPGFVDWSPIDGKLTVNVGNSLSKGEHHLIAGFSLTNGFSGGSSIDLTFTKA